jgi:hypothetical protein
VKDHAADQGNLTPSHPATPEQVVSSMPVVEVQELLSDLGMHSDAINAQRLIRLVVELGKFELAIEAIGGPATLGDLSQQPEPGDVRRAA